MRAEPVRIVGEAGAFQPDMYRRRHRAARPRLAVVPDPALRLVEVAFLQLLVSRHIGSLPVGVNSPEIILLSVVRPSGIGMPRCSRMIFTIGIWIGSR